LFHFIDIKIVNTQTAPVYCLLFPNGFRQKRFYEQVNFQKAPVGKRYYELVKFPNSEFHTVHPYIFKIIDILTQIQSETQIKARSHINKPKSTKTGAH